jgi:NAD(P)H-hydrate epimerase
MVQPLLTRDESRDVDRAAMEELGVAGLVLMENAGRGATQAVCEVFGDCLGRVVLLGGPGQNGGDAWVMARRLALQGHRPLAVLIGDGSRLRGDAQSNWALLGKLGVETIELSPEHAEAIGEHLRSATLVVDGLFGTGLDRAVAGGYAVAIAAMDEASAPLVSLDLPSGLDADTGAVFGIAPHAALTVTFAGHKRGLHQFPGVEHAGDVHVADIGVPVGGSSGATLWARGDLGTLIAPRAGDAHKGTNGHLLVIGGAPGKTGAAVLAGRAAFRAGAGLVTIGARADARAALEEKVIELMTTALPQDADQAAVESLCEGKRAVVVGPGLGLDELGRSWAHAFALHAPVTAVIDADGLTHVAEDGLAALKGARAPRILTPHPGEAARLLGQSTPDIQANRFAAAEALANISGQVVILKGARTIVAGADELRVCAEGTPALGVAGTGDVLSGVVGALAMTLSPIDAAIAGALLHALAGVEASVGDRGLIASEVADAVPLVLARQQGHWADDQATD